MIPNQSVTVGDAEIDPLTENLEITPLLEQERS